MKSSAILALGFILVVSTAALIPTTTFPDEPEPKAYRVAPIRRPPGHEERRRAAAVQAEAIESGRLAPALEEEAAIKPTPRRPVLTSGFAGMDALVNGSFTSVPPDTIAATGPDHIVEVVNASIAFFSRTTGAAVGSTPQLLGVFFSSLGTNAGSCIFDPVVAYDELAQRFYVGALDVPAACGVSSNTARLLYAVSNTNDPTAGFTNYAIDVSEPGIFCPGTVGGDFTRTSWNANAHVFTINMFSLSSNCYDHVSVFTIDKAALLNTTPTLIVHHADPSGTHFSLIPATMHDADPGDPVWFVEESPVFFDTIRVIKMTNVLSATPTFTETDIVVDTYGSPPSASQKGTSGRIDAGDTRILHVEWRDDRLVASHSVGVSGVARARWYEFDTSDTTPALTQQGTINQGSGVHTYYPSIAIAPNGDLGMTFMQSSSKKFMSMYVTGKLPADPAGTMQTPVLAKAGVASYRDDFDCFDGQHFTHPCRAGDYSGITVDPDTPDTFCAANEYAISKSSAPHANWGTWITCFRIGVHDLAVTRISAPGTVTGPGPVTVPVTVTIQNRSDHNETVTLSDLGVDATSGLVRLSVDVIDDGSETCVGAGVQLDNATNAALFSSGPKVMIPKAKLTVNFLVTYHCSTAVSSATSAAGDYSHTATVHHDVLDGNTDTHAADDVCPHDRLPGGHDPNPPSKGTTDNGCGARKSKTAFGNPVVTNVIAP